MRLIPNFKKCNDSGMCRLNADGNDHDFLLRHPRLLWNGFWLLLIAVLILPMVLWLGVVGFWFPVPTDNPLILVGGVGTFLIGCAAALFMAAFCNQYPGHWIVLLFLLSGTAVTALSAVKLYL